MQLSDIVKVDILTTATPITQAGFGKALILGSNASGVFDAGELVRSYSSVSAMLTDGFLATDEEYLMASALMSQAKKPSSFLVGVMSAYGADVLEVVFTGSLTTGTVSLKVGHVVVSEAFDTDQDTTMQALAASIVANCGDTIASAVWTDLENKLTITTVAGAPLSFKAITIGDFTALAKTYVDGSSTIATDLLAIDNQDSSWYALLLGSSSRADILAATSEVTTRQKLFGFDMFEESTLVASETDDLASTLKANAESRVIWMYSPNLGQYYVASWFGRMLPETPGAANWAYKTLVGVTAYRLTASEQAAINGKNGNMYETIGGVNIPYQGKLPNGSYIDILRGSDWLAARIQENVYALLLSSDKVPYTDAGFVLIQSAVYAILRLGVSNGLLVNDEYLRVTIPALADISASDKANRHLPDVKFYGHLSGAVNTVAIEGTLTLP